VLHEATPQAGGRCRSYRDFTLGIDIDNGNHLLLSGNRAARDFLRVIGSEHKLVGPRAAEFAFVDLASKERWTLKLGNSRLPWWIFSRSRRVPGTWPHHYLGVAPLIWARRDRTVARSIACRGKLYERLTRPLLLAALNIEPAEGSAGLAGAVIRESLLAGGRACRPLIARDGLTDAFIDPALAYLRARGAEIRFDHELRGVRTAKRRVEALVFADGEIALARSDAVVLAVPFWAADAFVPGLKTPTEYRAIVNAHFRIKPPADMPPIVGVINATVEWIFAFPDRISITISNGDRLLGSSREALAERIWQEVAAALGMGIADTPPPWQIVRERRATFAATPQQDALRPPARTFLRNLVLAGDWTDTGLPATIEGAIRSGRRAANLV
jgi:squalene-associated FAD-dependent desaturase